MTKKEILSQRKLAEVLKEVEQLGKKYFKNRLAEIILYGSCAKNLQDTESDIDVMFLFNGASKDITRFRNKIIEIMVDVSLKYDVVLFISESTISAFRKRKSYLPFYANVQNEGIGIYAGPR